VYLGQSPQHAWDVSLVLNLETGLVSPQFHVKLDSNFQTLREKGARLPTSTWQIKCGFIQQPTKAVQWDPASEARPTDGMLSMQQPEGVQPAAPTNDELELATEAKDNQDVDLEPQELPPLQRSRHLHHPVDRLTYAMAAKLTHASPDCEGELFCLEALFPDALAYTASKDPDTMYLHQAMKEPDKDKFISAMVEEMDAQLKGGNFLLILMSKVPKGTTTLPAVWQMKCKRQIQTHKIYKWKARLNIDGSHRVKGRSYWDTYAPVATWGSIQLILAKAIIQGWHSKQIDFVMAYTQAPVKWDMYMEIPKASRWKGKETMSSRSKKTSMARNRQVVSGTSTWWANSSPSDFANANWKSACTCKARPSTSCTLTTPSSQDQISKSWTGSSRI